MKQKSAYHINAVTIHSPLILMLLIHATLTFLKDSSFIFIQQA